jgi:hypothetical protein
VIQFELDRLLELAGLDSDLDEIELILNDVSIGALPQGPAGDWTKATHQFVLPQDLLNPGDNTLDIHNAINPGDEWGVNLIALRNGDTGLGNYTGAPAIHMNGVFYLVPCQAGGRDLELTCYDVDFTDELQLLVNGTEAGYCAVTPNNAWGVPELITLDPNQLAVVEVNNTYNPPRTFKWGVRQANDPN